MDVWLFGCLDVSGKLLEKSNFLLPKDFIGKVKRGYEIATNPDYYQEDGHETFNSETIADIHSARKELFDKTGIDLRYSKIWLLMVLMKIVNALSIR